MSKKEGAVENWLSNADRIEGKENEIVPNKHSPSAKLGQGA